MADLAKYVRIYDPSPQDDTVNKREAAIKDAVAQLRKITTVTELVGLGAAIAEARRRHGEVVLAAGVTAGAEVGALHDGEVQAMLVVVAGRAEAAPERARRRIAHEAPPARHGHGEALAP